MRSRFEQLFDVLLRRCCCFCYSRFVWLCYFESVVHDIFSYYLTIYLSTPVHFHLMWCGVVCVYYCYDYYCVVRGVDRWYHHWFSSTVLCSFSVFLLLLLCHCTLRHFATRFVYNMHVRMHRTNSQCTLHIIPSSGNAPFACAGSLSLFLLFRSFHSIIYLFLRFIVDEKWRTDMTNARISSKKERNNGKNVVTHT